MRAAVQMLALLAAVIAACVIGTTANPEAPWQIDNIADSPWQVTFVDFHYDCDADETVFTYSLTVNADHDLGHWVLSAPSCSAADVSADQEEWEVTTDPVTGLTGLVWSWGQSTETTRIYRIRLAGSQGAAANAEVGVSGGGEYAIGTVAVGPDCSGSGEFPEFGQLDTIKLDCAAQLPTDHPVGCEAREEPCAELVKSETSFPLCASEPVYEQTFRIETESSGFVWATQCLRRVEFDDSEAPQWDQAVPVDTTYECDDVDTIPAATTLSAVDDCGFDGGETVLGIESCEKNTTTECPQHFYIVRSWTAVDECGNERCATQTITVTDTNAPVFSEIPADASYSCEAVAADPSLLDEVEVTAEDSCAGPVAVESHSTEIADECTNTFLIRRTWKTVDPCGNEEKASQLITVYDNTPPVLTYNTSIPTTRTVECGTVPDAEEVTAFDECADAAVEVTFTQTPESPEELLCNERCSYTIERKWTACDDCDNIVELTRNIIVLDRTAPTFDLEPESDITVQCDEVPPQRPEPITDACDRKGDVNAAAFATCTEVRANTSCENEYTLTRTCTAVDCCGNDVSRTRVITVIDTEIVCPETPADITVQCNNIPEQEFLSIPEQACSADVTQTKFNDSNVGTCDYTVVRTWTFDDCSENQCTVSQSVRVIDDIDPVFDETPEDITVDCVAPGAVTVTATDDCQGAITATSSDVVDNECQGREVVTRTFTADDGCGNSVQHVQTITVTDNNAPTWDTFPADENLLCSDEVTVVTPTATDDCSTPTVLMVDDVTTLNGCENDYVRVITWVAVDDCGNRTPNRTQTITVTDPDAPVLTEPLPADTTNECSEISCPADVTASDNCEGITLVYDEERVDIVGADCTMLYELHRTWVATDDCGKTDTHVQVITVTDPNAPVYTGPDLEDMFVSCEDEIVLPTEPETEWTDDCGDVTFIEVTSRTTPSMECPTNVTITYTWTVRDECGNNASVSKAYHVYDIVAPTLEELADVTFECDEEVVLATPDHSDSCANSALTVDEVPTDLDCLATGYLSQIERTFTATDKCGNSVTDVQIVRVTDTTDPVMVCPASVIEATCCAVPDPDTLVATDNCDADQTIEAVTTRQDGSCVNTYNLTHVWTATDSCGNTATCTQVVVIEDNTFPTLEGVPDAGRTVSCEEVPKPEQVCASDDCGPLTLEFSEQRSGDAECDSSFTLTRTWTAIDACGHNTTASYDLTVIDDIDPEWTPVLPASSTRECDKTADEPSFATPACTDSCTGVTVTPSSSSEGTICEFTYSFGWACADDCGNTITHNVTVVDEDTTDPFFVWPGGSAPAATVSYDCEAPEGVTPTVGDACTVATLTYVNDSNLVVNESCPIQRSWTRVWTVTDECEHSVEVTQDVSINRPAPPTFEGEEAGDTIGCTDDEPDVPDVKAFDDCGNELEVSYSEERINQACTVISSTATEFDIVRTWTATDSCGQTITTTQTILVRDMADPVITVPAPRVQNNKCAEAPKLTGETATDDCEAESSCTSEDLNAERECPYLWDIEYTFTATDNCGKTDVDTVRETYTYSLKPYVFDAENIETMRKAECDSVNTEPDTIQWVDGCGQNITGGEVAVTTEPGTCPNNYVLVWNYTITDYCGQSSEFVIRTLVVDTTKPVLHFEWPVEDALVECPFVPPAPLATATDSCGGDVTIEFVEFKVGFDDSDPDLDCCNYEIFRVWKATDACGNVAVMDQKITVQDTIPPQWTGPEIMSREVECPEDVERPAISWFEAPFAHGFCASATGATDCTDTDTETFQFTIGGEEYTIADARFVKWVNGFAFLTGVASPAGGGNDQTVNFQFNLGNVMSSDGLAQAINKDTLKASCYEGSDGVVLAQWHFYEELQGNLTDTVTGDVTEIAGNSFAQVGLGATGRNELYGIRTTLTATAAGGEPVDGELVLQLNECDTSGWEFPELECGPELETSENQTYTETCPGTFVRTYFWYAWDAAGNSNSTSMTVTSTDSTDPVFTVVPPATASGVCEDPAVPPAEADDTCSETTVTRSDSERVPGSRGCDYHYSFTRTWTAVDECGNDANKTQLVSVEDNVDPTITLTGVPEDKTVQCYADRPAAATSTCADNCDENIAECTTSNDEPDVPSNCNVVITYSYAAADECGNTAADSYVVVVNDNTAPVCDNTTSSGGVCGSRTTTVSCEDDEPALLSAFFRDNCDGLLEVVPTRTRSGECPETIVDTYRVADSCNNTAASFTRTYVIVDTVAPVITVPATRTVTDCADRLSPTAAEEIASGAASATDTCGEATIEHVGDEDVYEGDCLVGMVRRWRSVDECGTESTAESYINVNDQAAPVFSPASIDDLTLTCEDDVPCPPTVSIADNCDGVHMDFAETTEDGACANERVITRTWTASDACGNSATLSYTITITDDIDPEWVGELPQSGTYDCPNEPSNSIGDVTATDSCGDVTYTYDETREDGDCAGNYTLTRTWTATDACNNTIDHVITVEVEDKDAPDAEDLDDIIDECDSEDATFGTPTFTDDCSGVTVTDSDNTVDDGCNGNFTITRTWVGTDECGHNTSVTQRIISRDNVAPTLEQPERTLTSECTATTPDFPASSDDCTPSKDLVPDSGEESTPDSEDCAWPFTVERWWSVEDLCGHVTTVYQTERVLDTIDPTLTFDELPEDARVPCTQEVDWPLATGADDCEGPLDVTNTSTLSGAETDCEYTETRFWEVCDCSGNCVNHTQVITYFDAIAPVFDAIAERDVYECTDEPDYPTATATDVDCTGEDIGPIVPALTRNDGLCEFNFTVTAVYTATDACGNAATETRTFEHADGEAPVISGDFSNITIECDEERPAVFWTCTDNCDAGDSGLVGNMEEEELDDGDDCENTRLVKETYTCTDSCLNVATETRFVRYVDTTAPSIDEGTLPPNRYQECSGDGPDEGLIVDVASDLTSPSQFGFIADAVSGEGACSAASGGFGVTTGGSWTEFNIDADSEPMWRLFNEGQGLEQYIKLNAEIVSSDDDEVRFDFNVKVVGYSGPGEAPCDEGRDAFVPPNGMCGPHYEFPFSGSAEFNTCYGDGAPADPAAWEQYSRIEYGILTGMGKCAGAEVRLTARGPPLQIGVGANGRSLNYGGSFWFQWVVTNPALDTAACPIPSGAHPGDVNIDMEVWDGSIIVVDGCPDISTITNNTVTTPGACPANFTETTTWTITDCVGNSDNASRIVVHGDSLPPVISNISLPEKLECGDELPVAYPVGTDVCDGDVAVSGPEIVSDIGDSCNRTITYRWTAVDECLNEASQEHSVSYCDTTDPVYAEADSELTYCCDEERRPVLVTDFNATDSCSGLTEELSSSTEENGCAHNFTVTWTWTATDDCGNSADLVETHVVTDNKPPTITTGEPQCLVDSTDSIFWKLEGVTQNGNYFTAVDTCDEAPTITITGCTSDQDEEQGATSSGDGFTDHCFYVAEEDTLYMRRSINATDLLGRLYTVTAQAEDDCGNTASVDRLHLIANGLATYDGEGQSSWERRNITVEDDNDCFYAKYCVHMCPPCVYDVNFCAEDNSAEEQTISLSESNYDASTDSTVFVYSVSAGASRVTLGLNLAQAEVLEISGASDEGQRFGFNRDSYFSGISWNGADIESDSFSLRLRGDWTAEEDNTAFQIKWEDEDDQLTRISTVQGPCKRADPGTASISGTIGVSGTVYGDRATEPQLPLGGIVVKLLTKSVHSPVTLAYTATAADGSYSFTNLNVSETFQVVIDEEGFLEGSLQGAHRYLTTDTNALVYQYGEPRCVPTVPATDANIGILIDELKWDTIADRARYLEPNAPLEKLRGRFDTTDTNFNGNSKSISFWSEQYFTLNMGQTSLMAIDSARFTVYVALADAKLASFGASAETLLSSGTEYQQRVAALALNHVSGYGVFRPFRELQGLVLDYAVAVGPTPANEATVSAMVLKMLSAN